MTDRPKTKLFVDGGDPAETLRVKDTLGFLDGQTTNPTLITKNPHIAERLAEGGRLTSDEAFAEYRSIVEAVSKALPKGSVSIEVYADADTTADQMFKQGKEMFGWIPNAHVKYPTTEAGLTAAERSIAEGLRVNLTLCFSQAQAAAVYAATKGAKRGQVFVSPFIGRLDDRGENGMQLIENILKMYQSGDGHVEVLTASVRSNEHFAQALALESDIITAPGKLLLEWAKAGNPVPGPDHSYDAPGLSDIPYQEFDLDADWRSFDLKHQLTDQGIERFSADWNALSH